MAIPTPISFWNFDESSGNAADALGVNTLTNNNTVVYSAGKINNGADLESSSSQSFSIADASQTGLDLSGDCSFAGWVKFESMSGTNTLFAKTDGNTGRSYIVRVLGSGDSNVMNAECYGDGTTSNRKGANSNAAFTTTTGTWFHFAATFDVDTGTWVFYKNGEVIASTASNAGTVASIYNSSNKFQIGASNYLGTDEQFFDGMIDMFGIWNVTLSAQDVARIYYGSAGQQYPFDTVLTEYLGSNDDYSNIGTGATYPQAQGFKVPSNSTCTGAMIYGSKGNTSSGTFSLSIYSGADPATTSVYSETFTSATVLSTYGSPIWNCIKFATPPSLTSGTQYYLRVIALTGSAADEVRWSLDTTSGSYADGARWTYNGSVWAESSTIDCNFGILGTVSASGPTNLKSLNTNVKANIKSYNTNVIANIKSINTNA